MRSIGLSLEQWHPSKNEGLTPHDVVCQSGKLVWWRCLDCGYEWQDRPMSRIRRSWDDCLACADVDLVPGRNDLATLRPDIAAEWHPTKNACKPSEVFPDYHMIAWWKGATCEHEWRAPIAKRTGSAAGALCPYCAGEEALTGFNDIATLCPELAKLWHPIKNRERTPERTSVCSMSQMYLWNGGLSDIWTETPRAWMLRNGYDDVIERFENLKKEAKALDELNINEDRPGFSAIEIGKMRTKWSRYAKQWFKDMSLEEWCLTYAQPELLDEWHPVRNGDLEPKDVSRGSAKMVWWRCPHGHEWRTRVADRTALNLGCSVCERNQRVYEGANDLASCKPGLLKWYSAKNEALMPDEISDRICREVWWECPDCGVEWQRSANKMTSDGILCPSCGRYGKSRRYLVRGVNDLATKRPILAAEWHPVKNGDLRPDDVLSGAHRKVWWQCRRGHEWQAVVSDRARGSGCPYCENRKVLAGFNDLATVFPQRAAEWHPTKNGEMKPEDISSRSDKKVWWQCAKGHEWKTSPHSRSEGKGKGCPYCGNKKLLYVHRDVNRQ